MSYSSTPVAASRSKCIAHRVSRAAWMVVLAALLLPTSVWAHDASFPMMGKQLLIRSDGGPESRVFSFQATNESALTIAHNPKDQGSALVIRGVGENPGTTGLIELDPQYWAEVETKTGASAYVYSDESGSRGGITQVSIGSGQLRIKASGENWPWDVGADQFEVWVHLRIEDEWFCSCFADSTNADVRRSDDGYYLASNAEAPGSCPDQICGNGIHELGEECDDGNFTDDDGCNSVCEVTSCGDADYESTYAAIQGEVFGDSSSGQPGGPYGCTLAGCHSLPVSAGLNLTSGSSYADLVGVPANNQFTTPFDLVEAGEPSLSFLMHKLEGSQEPGQGTAMPPPSGGVAPEHIEAISKWIRGGAPETGIVAGTSELLATCLDEPTPLVIDPPEVPAMGEGVQLQQTPWDLDANDEDEICVATYYDYEDVIPEDYLVECGDYFGANNPSQMCFYYNGQLLLQDPQSHHSIIHLYTGARDVLHVAGNRQFGPFTYKVTRDGHTKGEACDPKDVDPELGFNPDCSGKPKTALACIGYGVDDFNTGSVGNAPPTAPTFSGSQEPYYEQTFADGVYNLLPLSGVVVWNSHAFNLTSFDSTMSQYLNLYLAEPEDRLYQLRGIFNDSQIFRQNVPPFETREYCWTTTLPRYSRVFDLSSHVHRFGVEFKIYEPPRAPCLGFGRFATTPDESIAAQGYDVSCHPPPEDQLIYVSTEYTDPVQLVFDPPVPYDSADPNDRTFAYCATYDNGSTVGSPPVKLQSESEFGPPLSQFVGGGPCSDETVACVNGPNRGMLCGGDDSVCDDPFDPGGGICDACPVKGGVTTNDEMFIMLGSYYVAPPPSACGVGFELAFIAPLFVWLQRKRARRS